MGRARPSARGEFRNKFLTKQVQTPDDLSIGFRSSNALNLLKTAVANWLIPKSWVGLYANGVRPYFS